jgi:hypothetical protein
MERETARVNLTMEDCLGREWSMTLKEWADGVAGYWNVVRGSDSVQHLRLGK